MSDVGIKADELKERTARFAEDVVRFTRELPASTEARKIGGQLLDSATSVAANYRAACRARSHAEFTSKIGLVVEEADETTFWLAFLERTAIVSAARLEPLRGEASALLAIFTASHRTACARRRKH